MATIALAVLIIGVGTVFWGCVGLGRLGHQALHRPGGAAHTRPDTADVAVLIAAHNEEAVIGQTLARAAQLVPPSQIHLVSDGSTDATAAIARDCGVQVLQLDPNRGKAGALATGIDHFGLCDHYGFVLLLDADTELAADYLTTALPLFEEPDVVAVAGRATTLFDPPAPTAFGRFLVAYRERLYIAVQYLLKYGQAARWANAVSIVPGFASLYRTDALRQIDVAAPGLVIEDFNMTFEVHRKQLGRIEFHPKCAVAHTQDPDRLSDYRAQLRRWLLGFWQTVRCHGFHRGIFWYALAAYIVELLSACLLWLIALPLLLLAGLVTVRTILLGVLLPDYLLTVFAACLTRRPSYLLYGLAFPLMRLLDAALCLAALRTAWTTSSTGSWVSPTRRPNAETSQNCSGTFS